MPLLDSVGGLFRAVNSKADSILGAAKGLLCLPAIIAGAGDIFKDVVGSIVNSAKAAINGIIAGIVGTIEGLVQGVVDQITGAIQSIVQLIATIMSIVQGIKQFVEDLIKKANDALAWAQNAENCKFAAAALLKCIAAQVLSEVMADKNLAVNISKGLAPISKFTDKITSALSKPTGLINKFLDKASADVDRATALVDSTNIF
jgi:hypothetical protein